MARDNKVQVELVTKDNASAGIKKFVKNLKDIGFVADGLNAIKNAATAVVDGVVDAVKGAASFQGIEEAFEGITKSAGKSADAVLDSFKKQSAGMLSNRDAMLAYNKAAQLVGEDFANTLPDAMGYLSKVASATGQDMGFLTDSLVTGIGRLSPMILDNLGISVDLSEAYDVYAQSVGKSVEELTKQEQQTALTNQVMEKLAENTAALPDVAGQADTKMAALGATFQDLKDTIGVFLLPLFTSLLDIAGNVLDSVANKWNVFQQALEAGFGFWDALRFTFTDLTGAINFLETAFNGLVAVFKLIFEGDYTKGIYDLFGLHEDSPLINMVLALRDGLVSLGNWFLTQGLPFIIEKVQEFVGTVGKIVTAVKEWLDQHPDFVAAMLMVGGVILGAQLITTAFSVAVGLATTAVGLLKAGLALLFSPAVLIIGAITALLALLSSGEGGIAGALSRAAETARQLAFIFLFVVATAAEWLRTKFEELKTTVTRAWDAIKAATEQTWGAIRGFLESLWDGLRLAVETAFNNIKTFIENSWNGLKLAAETIWNSIRTAIETAINNIKTFIEGVWNDIKMRVETAWADIKGAIEGALSGLKSAFDTVFGAIADVIGGVISTIESIPGAIEGAVSAIGLIKPVSSSDFIQGAVNDAIGGQSSSLGAGNHLNSSSSFGTGGAPQDFGGRGMAGMPYRIGIGSKEEWFVPDSAGEFTGLRDARDSAGGQIMVTMNFYGVPDRATADRAADELVTSLRSRGIPITG